MSETIVNQQELEKSCTIDKNKDDALLSVIRKQLRSHGDAFVRVNPNLFCTSADINLWNKDKYLNVAN